MQIIMAVMLLLVVISAAAACLTKKLVPAMIIFMAYSLIMSAVWLVLKAPDLAITEAAVGAGITSVLFFIAFKRIGVLRRHIRDEEFFDVFDPEDYHTDPPVGAEEEAKP